jgi:CHAT domain
MSHPKAIKILALSANPVNTDHLRLDVEVRGIKEELERAQYRDRFDFINEGAVRVDDLSRAILKHKPDIVHFSGHGTEQGLVLEDDSGKMQLVSTESLSRLFKWGRNTVKCVFLNACYSKAQAEAIHQNIGCVIGMNQAIGDRTAIRFAAKFYQALVDGEAFQSAYEYACTALDLSGSKESSTPELLNRVEGNDPLGIATLDATQAQQSQAAEPLPSPRAQQSQSFGDISMSGNDTSFIPVQAGGDATVSQDNSRSNNISIGGSVTGSAITSGDGNTISVTSQTASLPDPTSVNIKAEIDALRNLLASLSSPDRRKIDNALDEIEEELQKPEPDKDEVGKALDRAVTYAQKANGFAEAIDKLRPHVQNTASWLGENWYKLLPLVGLAI